jgi:Stress responsive A/B Barrel Domain
VIAHVVLFRLKPGLTEEDRDSLAHAWSVAVRQIGSIRRAQIGPRVRHGRPYEQLMSADYPFAAILEFDDAPGLKAYLDHPAHEPLAQRFFACFESALMYDYELQDSEAGLRSIRNSS